MLQSVLLEGNGMNSLNFWVHFAKDNVTGEKHYCLTMRSIAIHLLIFHQYLLIVEHHKVIGDFPSRAGEFNCNLQFAIFLNKHSVNQKIYTKFYCHYKWISNAKNFFQFWKTFTLIIIIIYNSLISSKKAKERGDI